MKDVTTRIQNIDEERKDLEHQRAEMQMVLRMQQEKESLSKKLTILKGKEFTMRKSADDESSEVKKQEILLAAAHTKEEVVCIQAQLEEIEAKIAQYDLPDEAAKKFNKYICFSNIRELLKDRDVKIGQIEKEAGCQPGYMSRLDKPNNTSEPSVEFIITAAKMLGTSVDTLVSIDLSGMTPTEKYLNSFFDKLKSDTLVDKLDWNKETADNLNRMDMDINGCVEHPLFSYETFYEEGETEYPEEVSRIVFVSHSYGPRTAINGECYNLRMKNGTYLYLMSISKSVFRVSDPGAYAKEIWMYTPGGGTQFLVSNRNISPLSSMADVLYETVSERMKHPKLKKDLQYVIDAFMADDVSDDPDEGMPFF